MNICKLKKSLILFLAFSLLLLSPPPIRAAGGTAATSLTLDRTNVEVSVGGVAVLTAIVEPTGADTRGLRWNSSDASIATVASNGVVTGVAPGECVVLASIGSVIATCTVRVLVPVQEILLQPEAVVLEPGGTQNIAATVNPSTATRWELQWHSSNEDVAAVAVRPPEQADGTADSSLAVITAQGPGTTTIAASFGDVESPACTVTVSGVAFLQPTVEVPEGRSERLALSCAYYGNARNISGNSWIWTSSDSGIAKVDAATGLVTAVAEGSATIRCYSANGLYSAACTVKVVKDERSTITYEVSGTSLLFAQILSQIENCCLQNTQSSLQSITGLTVRAREGKLYESYLPGADTGIAVDPIYRYYRNASAAQRSLQNLSFVPRPGFYGQAVVTYTGYAVNGESYRGKLLLVVKSNAASQDYAEISSVHYNAGAADSGTGMLTVTADLSAAGARLIRAAYDEKGKFLSVELQDVSSGEGTYRIPLEAAERVKLILVDTQLQPLCAAVAPALPKGADPAFLEGSPSLSKINAHNVQVDVAAARSGELYYALLPANSDAPTAAELLSFSLEAAYGCGCIPVLPEAPVSFWAANLQDLLELTDYALYLMLYDAAGETVSGLVKLDVATPKATVLPVFQTAPTVTNVTQDSIQLDTVLSQDGQVFWVAIPQGRVYPQPNANGILTERSAIEQIVGGANLGTDGKSGSVEVQAYTAAALSIHGLRTNTQYQIFYVGMDTDGNYTALHVDQRKETNGSVQYEVQERVVQATMNVAGAGLRDLNLTRLTYDGTDYTVDAAFTITPSATELANPSTDWDMLLWADTSVDFELFRRPSAAAGQSDSNEWEKLPGQGSIIFPADAVGTFLGQSLNQDLDTARTEQEHPLNQLTQRWEYAIHITRLGGEENRDVWRQTVNFQVSIVAGGSRSLRVLATNVTEQCFADALAGNAPWSQSTRLEDIGTPQEFRLMVPFVERVAPNFSDGYPQFTPYDSSMQMLLMLNRPGTVYYVVAPFTVAPSNTETQNLALSPTINTRDINNNVLLGEVDPESMGTSPDSGQQYYRAMDVPTTGIDNSLVSSPDSPDWQSPFELSMPITSAIYSPRYTNPKIKTGSIPLGQGATQVTIEDLEPQTNYFVYFVLKGSGQVYSYNVLLYQFRTTPVDRSSSGDETPEDTLAKAPKVTVANLTGNFDPATGTFPDGGKLVLQFSKPLYYKEQAAQDATQIIRPVVGVGILTAREVEDIDPLPVSIDSITRKPSLYSLEEPADRKENAHAARTACQTLVYNFSQTFNNDTITFNSELCDASGNTQLPSLSIQVAIGRDRSGDYQATIVVPSSWDGRVG